MGVYISTHFAIYHPVVLENSEICKEDPSFVADQASLADTLRLKMPCQESMTFFFRKTMPLTAEMTNLSSFTSSSTPSRLRLESRFSPSRDRTFLQLNQRGAIDQLSFQLPDLPLELAVGQWGLPLVEDHF